MTVLVNKVPGGATLTADQKLAILESRRARPMQIVEKQLTKYIEHYMPNSDSITQKGQLMWKPTQIAGTALTTDYTMVQHESLHIAAVGYTSRTWSGLNIQVPSDGLMQLIINPRWNSSEIGLILTNANGATINIKYQGAMHEKNQQKTLQIWNPATIANDILSNSQVVIAQTGNFFDGSNIVTISFNIGTTDVYIDGLYTQTKLVPMICHAPDVSSPNIFETFCKTWKDYGWSAALRMCPDIPNPVLTPALYEQAFNDGFDIFNGSRTRGPLTTLAEVESEMGIAQNKIKSLGYNPILFSTIANNLPTSLANKQEISEQYGIRWAKSGKRWWRCNVVGAGGLDAPLFTHVIGQASYYQLVRDVDAVSYVGGFIMYFWHECDYMFTYDSNGAVTGMSAYALRDNTLPTRIANVYADLVAGGMTPLEAAQSLHADEKHLTTSCGNSGGGLWAEAIDAIAIYMKPMTDAGTLKVVGITELDLIMRGLA